MPVLSSTVCNISSRTEMFFCVCVSCVVCDSRARPHSQSKDVVTFDEFGSWYNGGGYTQAPWLELLDHSKWIPRAANASPQAAAPPPPPPAAAAPPAPQEESGACASVLCVCASVSVYTSPVRAHALCWDFCVKTP